MKNYVVDLSNDDLLSLCRIISARNFKDFFRKNPEKLNKIKLGYNLKKASEEETFSFVIKNRDEGFVCDFINVGVQKWLDEIHDHINALVGEGKALTDAITETLSKSVFSNQIKLFFLLSGEQYPEEYILMTQYAIELRARLEQAEEAAKTAEEEADRIEAEAKAKILESDEKLSALQKEYSELLEAKASIDQKVEQNNIQLTEMQDELDGYRSLAKYAISKTDYSPAPGYTVVSLCRKYYDDRGRDRLDRCADITIDGEISSVFLNETPSRTRLYQKDGPKQEGTYGIWDWTVTSNELDPQKERILTSYNSSFVPIEIIIRDDCSNVYDLVDRLKEGVSVPIVPQKLLLAFFNGAEYEGLLCSSEYLNEYDGGFYLSQNILSLAEFTFTENDMVRIDSKVFFRYLSTGLPSRIIKVKNPVEVTRDVILRRITKSVLKQKGFSTSEVRQVRNFLSEIEVETLMDDISSECDCSLEDAKQYIALFVNQADSILAGRTPENDIMVQIIRNNEGLLKECQRQLRQEWEDNNQELLNAAEQKLVDIEEECTKQQALVERKTKEFAALEGQIDALQKQIQSKQKLAADVEEQVNAKIEQARKNAASFIAENAFVHSLPAQNPYEATTSLAFPCFSNGEYCNADDLEVSNDWRELLLNLQAELPEAGVAADKIVALSGFLYAAYLNKMPILMAGPNGNEIANAFSLALFGCTPATLHCGGDYNENDLRKCSNSDTEVVIVENPFEHDWYPSVLKLLSNRNRYYILVHPFAEDLAIEPNSLINYCFPMFTDKLVDSAPTMNYLGGRMAEPFKAFVPKTDIDVRECYSKLLQEMKLSLIAKNTIQRILTDYHQLIPDKKIDNDYIFVLEPLALFLDKTDVLEKYKNDYPVEQLVGESQ
ncbi:MAG: hypothetical protein Q4E38_02580 [Eubacteriales bacterium]|nr:hypothetical protein [Eubacteriales bacterium]